MSTAHVIAIVIGFAIWATLIKISPEDSDARVAIIIILLVIGFGVYLLTKLIPPLVEEMKGPALGGETIVGVEQNIKVCDDELIVTVSSTDGDSIKANGLIAVNSGKQAVYREMEYDIEAKADVEVGDKIVIKYNGSEYVYIGKIIK